MNSRPPYLLILLAVAYLLPLASFAQRDISGLYLTWNDDPTSTMTVNWLSLYAEGSDNVWYRHGTEAWREQRGTRAPLKPSGLWVRRAQLTGLAADTTYEIAIGNAPPQGTQGLYSFRTMPAKLTRPVRFVTGGDMMHTREMVDAMNRQAALLDPDFALLGGDLAYANNVLATRYVEFFQSWLNLMRGRDGRLIPMVVAIGNHEVARGYNGRPDVEASHHYTLFDLPAGKARHVLDFGNYLSLVMLDTDHTESIAGEQAQWLDETLGARAQQRFLFACYHYPAYGTSKTPAGGNLPIDHPRAIAIREHWVPHFERHGVTAVFENDHHTFKRTHRLRGHQRDDANGILYLGDGAWGVETREVPSLDDAWYLAKAEAIRHLFHVVIHPNDRTSITAINDQGVVFDRVEMTSPRTIPVP